jgi:hypothetical protein|tara:strand:+ start:6722 stop:6823 length:102 start_codon:yes stop_codon:yes gene_type:complete
LAEIVAEDFIAVQGGRPTECRQVAIVVAEMAVF